MAGPEGDHDELQIDAGLLESLGVRLLAAAGMSDLCARTVSQHVVGNSLLGVDSHGIVRFSQYLEFISAGSIDPSAGPLVVTDEDAFTRMDGRAGHGVPAMVRLAASTADKARSTGMASGALVNCGHTGRIGAYAERAVSGSEGLTSGPTRTKMLFDTAGSFRTVQETCHSNAETLLIRYSVSLDTALFPFSVHVMHGFTLQSDSNYTSRIMRFEKSAVGAH